MNRERPSWFWICILLLASCATQSRHTQEENARKFVEFLSKTPQSVWAPEVSSTVKNALRDYQAHKKPDGKLEYGASVRALNLKKKSLAEIDESMQKLNCRKTRDVLKDPKTKVPLHNSKGQVVLMLVYLCDDGGVVRVKPDGDPTSRYRPQPHGSKSLRYPFNSKFENFDDEVVKIDNDGNAIPKWVKDLNQVYSEASRQREFIEGWAEDAHTDLPN